MPQTVGGQSDVGRLRRVAVKHARDAFGDAAAVERQWRDLGYLARPDITAATPEYERFLALLEGAGGETLRLPPRRPPSKPLESRFGAASPAPGPLKAGTCAGSTSVPWPWVGVTGPTRPASSSCETSSETA